MKKLLPILVILALAGILFAQFPSFVMVVPSAPSGSCSQPQPPQMYNGTLYVCNGTWSPVGTGSSLSIAVSGTVVPPVSNEVNFLPGPNITLTPGSGSITVTASNTTVGTAFSAVTSGVNTNSTLTVGNGTALSAIGTGVINATEMNYGGLFGTVPTWNQNTTGTAANATNVKFSGVTSAVNTNSTLTVGNGTLISAVGTGVINATEMNYIGLFGTVPTWNQNTTGTAANATNVLFSGVTSAVSTNSTLTVGNGSVLSSVGSGLIDASQIQVNGTANQVWGMNNTGSSQTWLTLSMLTSFSAGNLSPLFSTSVGTPTSTPSLAFSLSNAANNTVFGNFSGSLGSPSYNSLPSCSATSSQLLYTSGTGFTCGSLTPSSVGLSNVGNYAQTKSAIVPNTSPSAGQILVGNSGGTAYAPQTMSGDGMITSAGVLTVTASNGTVFGTAAFATIEANGTVVNPSGGYINFLPGPNITLTPGTGTITVTASNTTVGTAFSAVTGATNTGNALVVGNGSTLSPIGTGTITATSATTATNISGAFSGDMTGTQSATSVVRVNGGAVPASQSVVGTNGAGQIVAGPTSLPPNGSAGGDLSGTYPNPTVAKVNSGAVPTSQTTVGTNGSGQFIAGPTSLPPSGTAGGDLSGTYPNPTVAKINGGSVPVSAPLISTNGSAAPVTVTISGILKGNGTSAVTAAVAGTDYLAPAGNGSALTGITSSQVGAAQKVISGSIALPTSAIATGTCVTATAAATGANPATDVVNASANASIKAVTGYAPTGQTVQIYPPYLTSGQVNIDVCNPAANTSSITPGAVTLRWLVER